MCVWIIKWMTLNKLFERKTSMTKPIICLSLLILTIASSGVVQAQDFYAYYTRLDSGNSWEQNQLVGDHADIVVNLGTNQQFYFWRASSYLPRWVTSSGNAYVSQVISVSGDGAGLRFDKHCRHSHVRIIENTSSQVVVHWRYAPQFTSALNPSSPGWTGYIDEYFTILPNQTVTREIYDYTDSGSTLGGGQKTTQNLTLNTNGTITINSSNTTSFSAAPVSSNSSTVLPGGPDLGFGASYAKLGYTGPWMQIDPENNDPAYRPPSSNWNNNWQVREHPDVVVNFDGNSTKWVWWRGMGFVPMGITTNGAGYCNEFNEQWGFNFPNNCAGVEGIYEPMNEKQCRYNHVRILENTPARAVVHWRFIMAGECYTPVYPSGSPDSWPDVSDWTYYIYPDGTVLQEATLRGYNVNNLYAGEPDAHSGYEFHELLIINSGGVTPYDNLEETNTITLMDISGNTSSYNTTPGAFTQDDDFPGAPSEPHISRVNFQGTSYDGFSISKTSAAEPFPVAALAGYDGTHNQFVHWPVNNYRTNGADDIGSAFPTHSALFWLVNIPRHDFRQDNIANYQTRLLLTGVSTLNNAGTLDLAKSWMQSPAVQSTSGITSNGYDMAERAYKFTSNSSTMQFTLNASSNNPIHNPAFVIKNWGGDDDAALSINSTPTSNFKQGIVRDTDGTQTMVIYVPLKTTANQTFQITKVGGADTTPPTPNPATFASTPASGGTSSISMTAITGSDPSGPVEYFFTETTANPGGSNSAWQTSTSYTDNGLSPNTQYCYTVTSRDSLGNTGSASAQSCATTDELPDTTPPTPNPMTFTSNPNATSATSIAMAATTASDPSTPVEYFFTELTGNPGGSNSGWQTSTAYTDTGLSPLTMYTYTVTARDSQGNTGGASSGQSATTPDVPPPGEINLESGVANGVGSSWTTVNLANSYNSMVVVATPSYDNTSGPASVRIQNASGSSFQVRVDAAGGTTPSGLDVYYMVVEEGVYTQATDGVTMEAVKYNSTVTDNANSTWNGEARTYANSYSSPVVLGQVMTYNDAGHVEFWSYNGSNRNTPPSASALAVGKTVNEDPDNAHANETIGYIVIESGSGSMDGVNYSAGVTSDGILEVLDNNAPFARPVLGLSGTASIGVACMTAVDGNNGGWGVLYGANPISNTSIHLAIDEDQLGDSERNHTGEQVAFIVFEDQGGGGDTTAPTPNPATFASAPASGGTSSVSMTATAASDPSSPVEYFFTETSGNPGGSNSSWQTSTSYSDTGLSPSTQYCYTVTSRDSLGNTGSSSSQSCATTDSTSDTNPPSSPSVSSAVADSSSQITVTSTVSTDAEGSTPVEYQFNETTGGSGATDSGWQTSTSYVDSGLAASTQYCYQVRSRDSVGNTNSYSSASCAMTQAGGGSWTKVDDRHASVSYSSGGWSNVNQGSAYSGTTTWSGDGSGTLSFTYTFTGTGVRFYSFDCDGGTVALTIDGQSVGNVDVTGSCNASVLKYENTSLSSGAHTLEGTVISGEVEVDAFEAFN